MIGDFSNRQFVGMLQRRCWNVIPVSNPVDHALSERLALGAQQTFLIECGRDLCISH